MNPNRIAVSCMALTLVSGCALSGGNKVDDLKKVPPAEAFKTASDYGERVLTLTGGTREPADRKPFPVPCEGRLGELSKTAYFAAFNFQVTPIPEDQQLPTLRRLREYWQQQGYTIKRDREFSAGRRGEIAVENPADGFEIGVVSTDPPTALAVRINSPCYQADDPYSPVSTSTFTPSD